MLAEWFDDWVAGHLHPEGRRILRRPARPRRRAPSTARSSTKRPVLVVAHGALFRALRAAMGLPPNVRTPNAVPLFCEPGPGDDPGR